MHFQSNLLSNSELIISSSSHVQIPQNFCPTRNFFNSSPSKSRRTDYIVFHLSVNARSILSSRFKDDLSHGVLLSLCLCFLLSPTYRSRFHGSTFCHGNLHRYMGSTSLHTDGRSINMSSGGSG